MISLPPRRVMGKGTWGCCKLCYACGTQTLIITSSAGSGADEYPCWPQNRRTRFGSCCWSQLTHNSLLLEMKRGLVSCEQRRYQVRLHHKQEKRREDSIWEEVYHIGRVALLLVRDWGRGALIMAHSPHLQGSSFGCLSILQTEIQSVSEKSSMTLLGGQCEDTEQVLFTWQI